MIISVNWLKKFTDIDVSIDELATLIGARLVEIESVIDLGKKYRDVLVATVVECEKLEDSDHLNVTKIDDGGVWQNVERDENGYVQVVCGAPNVRAGISVAWLPPESTVPQTADDIEPFVLGARKLRGVMSNGMIASARELALFDEHDGILELDTDALPGTKFADVYELNDYLLDIENKSLTHRPDCFGVIGFAREIAAIQGKAFHTPEWLAQLQPDFGEMQGDTPTPNVTIDDPALSDRYQAVVLSDIDSTRQTPLYIQTYLARVGVRPINAVVDVTNYLMMLTGQPLHAFDYEKLVRVGGGDSADIHVRAGRVGETLKLLDGRTINLAQEDIVIAAGETAIGLAGAMGGADTEIDATTKRVIVESATFSLYSLRATQMRHGIFSEAITRFTKGQPAELTAPVLADAVRLMCEWTGAKRVSDIAEAYPGKRDMPMIELSAQRVNATLGTDYSVEQMRATLKNVEFDVTVNDANITVQAPYWRSDIHIVEDIIEEIGRINSYDAIELTLPKRDFTAVRPSDFDELRTAMRKALVRAGASEVLTYSFIHGDVLRKVEQDPADSYRITNSISPDLQYYRQSLTPSLLGLVNANVKNGYDQFALFEMNKVHSKSAELVEAVPAEMHRLALILVDKKEQTGAPYYQAKRMLDYMAQLLGMELTYKPLGDTGLALAKPFEPRRSARVVDVRSGQPLGVIGEYKKSVSRGFKLPVYAAGFELLPEAIAIALNNKAVAYTPLSRYPSSERDICFQVEQSVVHSEIIDIAKNTLSGVELLTEISPLDIYQPQDGTTKNVTIRIKLTANNRTLAGQEVSDVIEQVTVAICEQLGATVI
jgi:phenylalanyl-tRNA synthetase beta chain